MYKQFILATATCLATGCASLDAPFASRIVASDLQGQSIARTARKPFSFVDSAASKSTFATFDARAASGAADVWDPADAIATALTSTLAAEYAMSVAADPVMVSDNDRWRIPVMANVSRFVLDVQTAEWGYTQLPGDEDRLRVVYRANAWLIDPVRKAVVAQGFCSYVPESESAADTHVRFMENDAALLRANLAAATAECVRTLKSQMGLAA